MRATARSASARSRWSLNAGDSVHQRIVAGRLGAAIEATSSFVLLTETSKYVPTLEDYAQDPTEQILDHCQVGGE